MYGAAVSPYRSLLGTKLFVPPPRARLVARPRLTETLDDALRRNHKLILLAAPAGFGKTTVLSSWLAAREASEHASSEHASSEHAAGAEGRRDEKHAMPSSSFIPPGTGWERPLSQAWLSLDPADNDLARFLLYLIAAFEKLAPSPEPWDELSDLARTYANPDQSQILLTLLINRLTPDETTRILVLDDYHSIDAKPVHDVLTFLIERLPPHYHIVLTTRADPSLPLARLRAGAQLTELRAGDLRFTPEEAAAFLNQTMGLQLTAAQMEALETRTEGWVAGLQLAALALQSQLSLPGTREVDSFISGFAGSNRYVMDYLAEEVLASQPEAVQQFLLQTCILDRLCGSLCDAVAARGDSAQLLEQLERLNLFVNPLDDVREWYRYHHLFADLLRHHLAQRFGSEHIAELHRRAGAWFEGQGLSREAIQHALAAGDFERAAQLVERSAETFQKSGEYVTLQAWLDQFPAPTRRAHPALGLLRANIFLTIHDLEGAAAPLQEVETSLGSPERNPQVWAHLLLLRARLAHRINEHHKELELAEQGLEILPPQNPTLEGRLWLAKGNAAYYVGASRISLDAFVHCARLSRESGDLPTVFNALSNQVILHILMGQLRLAGDAANQGLALAEGQPAPHLLRIGSFYSLLGAVRYEWNQLLLAREALAEAILLSDRSYDPYWMMLARVWLARTRLSLGDTAAAAELLEQARQTARKYHFPRLTQVEIVPVEIQLWQAQGKMDVIAEWVRSSGLTIHDALTPVQEPEHVAFARALILLGETAPALEFLERLATEAQAREVNGVLISILALKARAYYSRAEMPPAWQALTAALLLARPEGYVRTFVDEGEPMHALLTELGRELRANRPGRITAEIRDHAGEDAPRLLLAYVLELRAAFAGGTPISPALLTDEHTQLAADAPVQRGAPVEPLTERELQVLQLIARGHSNQEIARMLVVEPGTVKKHINNLYGKLGVISRTQAVRRARELGLDEQPKGK